MIRRGSDTRSDTRSGTTGNFRAQVHNRGRGQVGENVAARWLVSQGYRIEERNYSNSIGEIDTIAWDGPVLCFIEVKTRTTDEYGQAIEAVHRAKQNRIGRIASLYLVRYDDDPPPCRFDVLGMDLDGDSWRYTLIKDAFQLGS